jgi:enoyl-CoA hydratase/carnithine racemase
MLNMGFLTEIVAPDSLLARVDALSEQLAGMAPLALLGIKKHLNLIARGQLDEVEIRRAVAVSEKSNDMKEGALAWKEKRRATFNGS